jgi:hypothetical protein
MTYLDEIWWIDLILLVLWFLTMILVILDLWRWLLLTMSPFSPIEWHRPNKWTKTRLVFMICLNESPQTELNPAKEWLSWMSLMADGSSIYGQHTYWFAVFFISRMSPSSRVGCPRSYFRGLASIDPLLWGDWTNVVVTVCRSYALTI